MITSKIDNFMRENIYSVSNVPIGFRYWYQRLLGFMLTIFQYEGLPESLPSRELELCLLLQGYATPFRKDNGDIICIPSDIYGYDEYYTPTMAIFGNPEVRSKRLYLKDIDGHAQNSVLMYNTELHNNIFYVDADCSFNSLICRYARRLADLESSENIYTAKLRMGNAPVSGDDNVNKSIKKFIKKILMGDMSDAITDDAVLSSFRSVEMGNTNLKDDLVSFGLAKDKILEQFFREIGVKFHNTKRAQMSIEEASSDEQVLMISLKDVERERIGGIERFNEFFGTNASVKLNPEFDRANFSEEGGMDNDKRNDQI